MDQAEAETMLQTAVKVGRWSQASSAVLCAGQMVR